MSGIEMDINLLNAWNEDSMSSLYDLYYRSLVVYASQIVDMDTAEDIVQEKISLLWERRPVFDSENQLSTYLYNSVRNAALSHLRHESVKDRYRKEVVEMESGESSIEYDEDKLNKEEVYRQLMLGIDGLPPRQREIFLLCMKGKKNSEIAEQLGISAETVKVQKRRAMISLRGKLTPAAMLMAEAITVIPGTLN